jgi:hypothetical protein
VTVLEIAGKQVEVDDSFMQLPPDQQNKTVEEIAGHLGASSSQPPAEGDGRAVGTSSCAASR